MSRYVFKFTQILFDLVILSGAFVLAYLLRYEWAPPVKAVKVALFLLPYAVALQYVLLMVFGVPRFSWRHVGLREANRVAAALGTAMLVFLLARLIAGAFVDEWGYARYALIPTGVIIFDALIAVAGVIGVRVLRRLTTERAATERRRRPSQVEIPTLLIGAGQAGLLVAKEVGSRPDLAIRPVGFIDDDPNKSGLMVHGIPVVGTTESIARAAEELGAAQALITFANAPGTAIRRVTRVCDEAGLKVKVIPGLFEIVGGQVNLSRIRDVAIEDLLRREPVKLDEETISAHVRGKVVLVTGAGGSIGSEICRQLVGYAPERLILVERAENCLFNVHRQLVGKLAEGAIVPCIADITDGSRMRDIFSSHRPHVVYHAAAHKHVPMMEWNPAEALKNNVLGTRAVADLADRFAAEAFVMISTDKAVNPTSVMGASKRAAEIYVQALQERSKTAFVTVRFGNVLGSAGSVIPIFREQIAAGGPVTVTHPDMQRYFMTIPEACQLVLEAGAMGNGGEIFILDMGEPVHIVDLARDLITLSGLRPGDDIDIEFTGTRPGEKLYEELADQDERAEKTRHPKIFVGHNRAHSLADAIARVEVLKAALETQDDGAIRGALHRAVPEYTGASETATESGRVAAPSARVARLVTDVAS